MWQFWIDRGGTFTDIVAQNADGTLLIRKFLSENPEQYEDAAIHGIRNILNLQEGDPIPTGAITSIKIGTTVATNALLERRGERVLLLITQGMKDLLRIGYQNRPKLFDLQIVLPEPLYEEAIEVEERLSYDGEVITPIHVKQLRHDLQKAYDQGFRAVAVAFMHAYRFPEHERITGKIAQEIGFEQISLSHQASPLLKLVSRGDTTVVDAYLSPILHRYVQQVRDALISEQGGNSSLMFMQSNGGLTDASLFQGKDAILSGPAGGVVGMVKTAQAAGFDKIIGFDMGGTSTDVCHFAGEYERSFETEVAGVRMRAPMMSIHTVAAGGGSILSYKEGRLQAGPQSAGADPGPACYRRGGPLTVTDCNILLGNLRPEQFPAVFGPNADQPLDVEIVREKFLEINQFIADESGETERSSEELAEGFLRIAVENMANAIKKISVERGYDVTQYAMNCFGGAGGQHACLIADLLGIKSIFIHPFAGVLSAFGMGLADVRALREYQFEQPISNIAAAEQILEQLDRKTKQEIIEQGIADEAIRIVRRAYVRTGGSHQSLPIPFNSQKQMREDFETAHKRRFGFVSSDKNLIIEVLTSEAIGDMGTSPNLRPPTQKVSTHPQKTRIYRAGKWLETLILNREELAPGFTVSGPAIIFEPTGTNVIEPEWQAEIIVDGNLIIRRETLRQETQAIGTKVNPIMLEVFNNRFMSIAEQMGATLANTAYSVNIKERWDFSCAIFTPKGDLVANAPHVPVHLGSMSVSVRKILEQNATSIKPGNVYMMNNPFNGGTHLPDVTVITPVFDKDNQEIIFVVASRGHHADIGGKTPGSGPPDSRIIEEEGVLIENSLLVEEGVFRKQETRKLLASGKYPCRNINQNLADLTAQIAANATGVKELLKMTQQYGLYVTHAYMGYVQDNAEESVRRVILSLQDGSFTLLLDNGSQIQVSIKIDSSNREALIDFTGTSGQDSLNYNAPSAISTAVVLYVFRTLVGSNIPMNEGCLKPLIIKIPENCMLNPKYPAAVISGNTEVSQALANALYGALGILAGSQGTMNNFIYGNEKYQNYETICGGTGAGDGFHGADAVHSHMTNTRMTDPEILENRFPVRVEEFSIRQNSGGAGTFSGGNGIIRRLRFLEEMTVTVLSSNRIHRPFGTKGGLPGKSGENSIFRAGNQVFPLKGNDQVRMISGDVFILKSPGGGGFGPLS